MVKWEKKQRHSKASKGKSKDDQIKVYADILRSKK